MKPETAIKRYSKLIGERHGKLVVKEVIVYGKDIPAKVLCRCDCGTKKLISVHSFVNNEQKSCGCGIFKKHGDWNGKLYKVWTAMKSRCKNPNFKESSSYFYKGITVCDEWQEYIPFRDWAFQNGYKEGLTLDRINNDGNYCPENCRWVTYKVQNRNTSRNKLVTYEGKTMCVTDFAISIGMNPATLRSRIFRKGWDVERAITEPVHKTGNRLKK